MGQGYSLSTLSAGAAGIDVPELSDLTYEKSLGTARFLKAVRARHQNGLAFIKVVVKSYPEQNFESERKAIAKQRRALRGIPNALAFERIIETSSNGYLVRQYIHSSLYDRISTHPFLEPIEKKWIAFQLLSAVRDCHAAGITHGDIKSENVLVTSWSWLYLTDFSSSFKPVYLPEDNPANFSYFFDTSGRRTCYLAPERFLGKDEERPEYTNVTEAMDVFSVGCVIAELFLESPVFTLSSLFRYRGGEITFAKKQLEKIGDPELEELIMHMISIDPNSRYTADDYLAFWKGRTFPDYFYGFLHQYMTLLAESLPHADHHPDEVFQADEADLRIDRIHQDLDKISALLEDEAPKEDQTRHQQSRQQSDILPVCLDIPNARHEVVSNAKTSTDRGSLLFLPVVEASIRNATRSASKVAGCDLLLALAERVPDEAKMNRILPYFIYLLRDKADIVRVAAIRSLTQLVAMVTVISPSNAYVFSDYILSSLEEFALTRNSIVRCTYASCLSHLAVSAARLLDSIQALRADGSVAAVDPQTESSQTPESHYQRLYDAAYSTHVEEFQKHARSFLEDRNSFVRRAFLKSVPALCVFFGSSIANDVLLSHLNTYLNDPDWKLRWVFYETMVAISIILGSSSAQDFILPLMTQGLQSSEEYIIERVIRSLSGMADLGFLHRAQLWKMAEGLSRFLIHPSVWIRDATATFIAASTRYLPTSDIHCILGPIIYPYLRNLILQYDLLSILGTLKKPLARPSYEMAVYWSMSYSKGVFWLSVKAGRTSTQSDGKTARNHSDPSHLLFNKVKRNAEDEQWISKLRDTGLSREDEWKILVLREQIWYGGRASPSATPPNSKIKLATTGVQIHIVMWNDIKDYTTTQSDVASNVNAREGRSASLADALLEASTTIDLPSTRQQRLVDSSRGSRDSSLTRRRPQAQNIDSIVGASFTPSPLSSTPLSNSSDTITDAKYRQGRTARPTNTNGTKLRVPDGLSHRGSAIELLGTNGGAKSSAEPAITAAKAEGKMGSQGYQPPSDANELLSTQDRNSRPISHSAVHTYEGDDPDILHLLEDMYIDKHPSDVPEFGANPQISRRRPIKNNAHRAGEKPWHPDGTLIALFTEHIGSINRVLVAPDSEFFLTASDDGTVKVWDSSRLERNISNRSRQTWRHPRNSPIKALCFIEHSHTFVAGAADGSIHVVRVDHNTNSGMGRYGKLRQLKHAQLIEGEKALWIEHHQFDGRSTLFVATNQCHIVALDTKSMTELFALDNPVHHGIPTSFCLDRRRTWLVIGTSHGILDQWDLRFRLLIRSWGIGGTSPIHRVCLHPLKARSTNYRKRIYVAGGSAPDEITVWDVEKAECKEVYRVGALPADQPRRVRDQPVQGENEVPSTRLYEPWFLDEGSKRNPEAMLKLFGTALDPTDAAASPDRGIRAMAVGIDIGDGGIDAEYPFMLTGNSDRKVRFWDLSRVEGSRVVWGQSAGAAKPAFRSETPLVRVPNLVAHYEVAASSDKAKGTITGAGKETPSIGKREAQRSLEDHVDVIMDVAVLQKPYGMVVTVDRAGIIRVFS